MDPAGMTVTVGLGAQLGLLGVAALLRDRRRERRAELYRLSALVQCLLTGALGAAGSWWAVLTLTLAVLGAWAAATEPVRYRNALIHAERSRA